MVTSIMETVEELRECVSLNGMRARGAVRLRRVSEVPQLD